MIATNGMNGTHSLTNGSAYTNGTTGDSAGNGINYDRLKQELVIEFRKELQSFKGEIINGKLTKE